MLLKPIFEEQSTIRVSLLKIIIIIIIIINSLYTHHGNFILQKVAHNRNFLTIVRIVRRDRVHFAAMILFKSAKQFQ